MDLMVNPVITDFQQDVNGDIKMLKLGANKEDAWTNIAEQGSSAKLDNNKTATINVSTYTEPVEITPTSGKDGMKKATVTLSNIPSTNTVTFYAWAIEGGSPYFTLSETPSVGDNLFSAPNDSDYGVLAGVPLVITEVGEGTVTISSEGDETVTYSRASTKDLVFNKASS